MTNLRISEIFYSIQGEGLQSGRPCVLVRLQGCNLRCRWCDTAFAQIETTTAHPAGETSLNSPHDTQHEENCLSVETVMAQIEAFNCRLVLITGGEPLLQPAAGNLMTTLIDRGYEVLLETNGSILISRQPAGECYVPDNVSIALDLKCPGSNMHEFNNYDNVKLLNRNDVVKFVVAFEDDFDWAIKKIIEYRIYDFCDNIIFSAVATEMTLAALACCLLALSGNGRLAAVCRLQVQLHKVVWPNDERGR